VPVNKRQNATGSPEPCLAVIDTHPVQYRAPLYRALQERYGVRVCAIYGSDFSVAGYEDKGFQAKFAWDTDLLLGYSHLYLSTVDRGAANEAAAVSARGLSSALKEINPAAILLLAYDPRFHKWAWFHALRSGLPILFRGETIDATETPRSLPGIRAKVLNGLYKRCASLLYIGQRSKRHYSSIGCPDDKLTFSPYCVDAAVFAEDEAARSELRARTRLALGLQADDRAILFSGKLCDRKRPDLLISALKASSPDVRAKSVIVYLGSGELQPALAAEAASDPIIQVRFMGFRNQKELSPYYHAADLLVLPSRFETWGLVVNDALHHGLPCIASDSVGCAPDLVIPGVTGEIFATDSVESLAGALDRVSALIGRPDVRQACRDRVAAYSIDKAAEGIARAYRAAIA
jgi:glycosyltransferase involved in cell wall biosynthesis